MNIEREDLLMVARGMALVGNELSKLRDSSRLSILNLEECLCEKVSDDNVRHVETNIQQHRDRISTYEEMIDRAHRLSIELKEEFEKTDPENSPSQT